MADFMIDKEKGTPEKTLTEYRKDFRIVKEDDHYVIKGYKSENSTMVIPAKIKGQSVKIAEGAFESCYSVVSVELEDGVTEIVNRMFAWCANLQSITIPDSVTSIGEEAFYQCESLQSVTIPGGVTKIERNTFQYCRSLQSVKLPDRLTSIGYEAFSRCIGLQSVTIPDGVQTIDAWAFCGCQNLQSITIPDSVTSIGEYAFYNCNSIQTGVILPTSEDKNLCKSMIKAFDIKNLIVSFLYGNIQTNPTMEKLLISQITAKKFRAEYIPDLIKKQNTDIFEKFLILVKKMSPEEIDGYLDFAVDQGAAEIITYLIAYRQKLYPPEKIEEMREIEFEKAMGIREMTVTDYRKIFQISKGDGFYRITGYKSQETIVDIPEKIQGIPVKIGDKAFWNCEQIRKVYVNDTVTEIGDRAFQGCMGLADENGLVIVGHTLFDCFDLLSKDDTIVIPDTVTAIEKQAFSYCLRLKSVVIPEGVTSIGEKAFFGCENLQSVVIPDGVKKIEKETFRNCRNLQSLWIGKGVIQIGVKAFHCSCSNLQSIVVEKGNPVYHSENNCLIDTENKTLILGCSSSIIPDGVTSIGVRAFYGCENLESIAIPTGVTSIGYQSFSYCTNLKRISIPKGVTEIENYAFDGCFDLWDVTIPESVRAIGKYAFYNCPTEMTVCVSAGSYAESFIKKEHPFKALKVI